MAGAGSTKRSFWWSAGLVVLACVGVGVAREVGQSCSDAVVSDTAISRTSETVAEGVAQALGPLTEEERKGIAACVTRKVYAATPGGPSELRRDREGRQATLRRAGLECANEYGAKIGADRRGSTLQP